MEPALASPAELCLYSFHPTVAGSSNTPTVVDFGDLGCCSGVSLCGGALSCAVPAAQRGAVLGSLQEHPGAPGCLHVLRHGQPPAGALMLARRSGVLAQKNTIELFYCLRFLCHSSGQ